MSSNVSRRIFVQTIAGTGAILSAQTGAAQEPAGARPVLLSSGSGSGLLANEKGWEILGVGGSALDAVEKGANAAELDPSTLGIGYGGLPNEDGVVELDASIMWGPTGNAGAVASLRNIKTPCSVARKVMERTDHVLMVGKGALRFARAHGFEEHNLLTEKARKVWLTWKEINSNKDDWLPPEEIPSIGARIQGTINVLAVDENGDVGGITTTSGLAYKIPGRVGDSPIIGAGLYVDNAVGAAGATGRGEAVIKMCGSFLVVENMRRGMSPQEACEDACQRLIERNNGSPRFNVKFVALRKDGQTGCAQLLPRENQPGASYTVYDHRGNHEYFGPAML
jgi:N4-(beta-N-acetylglucosaminyl)-L-asparaginase